MRGPRPKPTVLRRLHGSDLPQNPAEPIPEGDLVDYVTDDCPPDFSADEREIWEYAVQHAPPGLVKRIDASVLRVWVKAYSLHRRASAELQNRSLFIRQGPQIIPNPLLSIINKQAVVMMRSAELLGFTPTSRTRIQGTGPAAETMSIAHAREKDPPRQSLEDYLANAPRPTALN